MRDSVKILFAIFIFYTTVLYPQTRSEGLKRQAEFLIGEGRYKEAIDQLNKFISANPQLAEGYHTRGLCYEKTTEYQYSVLDLRRARRLDPGSQEIQKDLNRVIAIWHKQLYQKIEGHKRDIAIDPNYAFSYLEIGKCYRWLEEWNDAEIWYDEYLKRDDNASPDEIIRYTEILAKTGSITKGEKILKKYVERYPGDWRLWSRYGYFTLWLGKYKIAEDAFVKALDFKPFFKEAEDGLDQVRNQAYMLKYQPRSFERVYPIDRYYSALKKNPENDETRFNLINELITANRYEESYQQLQFLQSKYSGEERFKSLYKTVSDYRDSTYNTKIAQYTEVLKNNPNDKETVIKLSEAYANLLYYDSAIEILSEYLQNVPDDHDLDVRFLYAKYCAWNYEWENAIAQLNKLLELDPENLDCQLLRGQIAVWTVLDFDIAEKYLLNVISKRPDDLSALISLASMYSWKKNFPEAKKYLDETKRLDPTNPEVESAESNYALHVSAYEEVQVFEIRKEAGNLALEGNCEESRAKYEEYFSKRTAPTRDELIEYADVVTCTGDYPKAIEIYNQLLNEEFDYKIALQRARNYYYNKDSLTAQTELESLSKLYPDDNEAKLYLADAYAVTAQPYKAEELYRYLKTQTEDSSEVKQFDERMALLGEYFIMNHDLDKANELYDELLESTTDTSLIRNINQKRLYLGDAYALADEWGDAEDIYDDLLEAATDTADIRIINQRMSWVPPSGFSKGLSSFGNIITPTNVGAAPFFTSYRDNQDFTLMNYGGRVDAGFIGFLGLGALWSRTNISINNYERNFTTFKGIASIFFSKIVSLAFSYGVLTIPGEKNKNIGDVTFRIEEPERFSIAGYYENNDARLLLYSPNMLFVRLKSELYRFSGYYQYKDILRISLLYSYYKISDTNKGNDFQLRLGKKFFENSLFGYEYYFADYAFISQYYYSPQKFASHSLWGEYKYSLTSTAITKIGGKIGYVPNADFIVSEFYGELNYKPFPYFNLTGRAGYADSFRYDSSYKSLNVSLSVYWSVF
ncbi:MAG: tetratricopeptide repeat protein [Ignavibacteriales bacterium]|nr:tetratricopeptide repeat protein [Ignavibacteriales bacterium]